MCRDRPRLPLLARAGAATEWLFTPGGSLRWASCAPRAGSASELDTARDVNALLADWRPTSRRCSLLDRMPTGQIDPRSGTGAAGAPREVRKAQQDIPAAGEHAAQAPRCRLFLLADLDPNLMHRYGL
jgi:hypothetical protein